ncbi:hypothetical protein AYO21_09134 [Fonsecaea monophora]|uniref:Uncharacterized protein n=1 Tax=Fonsecaea monophora TaxID=254056 RepID=A0A177F0C1_9EURO|nr:hypothetical protein AYO21_09134 [Fonsecaea monophora]OAG36659.1 hypothetical protein AYO21_09134 [Fonsecaea monophora]
MYTDNIYRLRMYTVSNMIVCVGVTKLIITGRHGHLQVAARDQEPRVEDDDRPAHGSKTDRRKITLSAARHHDADGGVVTGSNDSAETDMNKSASKEMYSMCVQVAIVGHGTNLSTMKDVEPEIYVYGPIYSHVNVTTMSNAIPTVFKGNLRYPGFTMSIPPSAIGKAKLGSGGSSGDTRKITRGFFLMQNPRQTILWTDYSSKVFLLEAFHTRTTALKPTLKSTSKSPKSPKGGLSKAIEDEEEEEDSMTDPYDEDDTTDEDNIDDKSTIAMVTVKSNIHRLRQSEKRLKAYEAKKDTYDEKVARDNKRRAKAESQKRARSGSLTPISARQRRQLNAWLKELGSPSHKA